MDFARVAKLLLIVSFAMIVITVIAALFAADDLSRMCICTSNKLAWAWIFAALSMIFSLKVLFLCAGNQREVYGIMRRKFILLLTVLQMSAFVAASVYLILFGAKVLNVI